MKMENFILHPLTKPFASTSSFSSSSSTSLSDGGVYSKFEELVVHLGDVGKVSRVYAIDHPSQRTSFENYRTMITEKHADSEGLFKKDGWRQASDAAVRKRYLLHLAEKMTKFRYDFNDGDQAFVLPVVQGTSENAAFRIIKNGFGTVASLDDGFYGQGKYFTSRLQYAARYAQITPNGKVFLIALTVPGNPYPVTEPPFVSNANSNEGKTKNPAGLVSQPCQKGYQSHYVEVTREGYPVKAEGLDVQNNPMVGIYSDELVLFEGSQTLPLFLVYTTQYGSSGGGEDKDKMREGPKEWSFLNQGTGEDTQVGASDVGTPQGKKITSEPTMTETDFFLWVLLFVLVNRWCDETVGGTDLHRQRTRKCDSTERCRQG